MSVEDFGAVAEPEEVAISQQIPPVTSEPELNEIMVDTSAAELQQEEKLPPPNEDWTFGELIQAKKKHLRQLAQKVVERFGSKMILDEKSSIPSEEAIKKATLELDRMEASGIELQDGVVAAANQELIEFYQGEEYLGVCSYSRFATQVYMALEEWSKQKPEPSEPELTDLQIAREVLELDQILLNKCLKDLPDEKDVHIRRMKIKVAALASFVCDLDDIENPAPEQPELPLLKNNDERKAWLENHTAWGLWYEDKNIGAKYYKYDFPDGTRLIADEYQVYTEFVGEYTSSYLHLVGGPRERPKTTFGAPKYPYHERYNRYPDSVTELVEFLKELQKKEKQK